MLENYDNQDLPNIGERRICNLNVITYEDILQALVKEIHFYMPRLHTLNQFFQPYDIFVGRVF